MNKEYPKVLVIGLGRVGHACLNLLASRGFSDFVLLDHDRIEKKNIQDTRYLRQDIGKRKVEAAAELVFRANPRANIKVLGYTVQATDFAWLLRKTGLLDGWTVAVFAFDDPNALVIANEQLYPLIPICFPGVHRQAESAHVIYTIPGTTPCLTCAMQVEDARPLSQLRPRDARFGVETSDTLAHCVHQIILEICGHAGKNWVQPQTGRTILFLRENLRNGTWWQARRMPQCPICTERR